MKPERIVFFISLAIVCLSTLLLILSTPKLSNTHDEGVHIGSGLEWFQGSYVLSPQNPPLSRLGAALFPYLKGYRLQFPNDFQENFFQYDGLGGLLYRQAEAEGSYADLLIAARLGVLLFFLVSALLVFLMGRLLAGTLAGSISLILFASQPVVLAHSGLATTDVPSMTTYLLAIYFLIRWLSERSWPMAAGLGISLALAILTKFTALLFLLPVILIFWGVQAYFQPKHGAELKGLAIAALLAVLTVWGVYRFSFGKVGGLPDDAFLVAFANASGCYTENKVAGVMLGLQLPAPEFFKGLVDTWCLNQQPFPGYLFGEFRPTGSPWFYLVALGVKTPLPSLFLLGAVIFFSFRYKLSDWRLWGLFGVVLVILSLSFFSNLNIGVRHIIQIYPFLALITGVVSVWVVRRMPDKLRKGVGSVLGIGLLLQVLTAYSSWPHWLSYFNAFGGKEPGRIIVDSDLDWGQGVYELEAFFADKEVDTLHISLFHTLPLCHYQLPPLKQMKPDLPVKGWVAINEFNYRGMASWGSTDFCTIYQLETYEVPFEERFAWLREHEPLAKVGGGSIRIYYLD